MNMRETISLTAEEVPATITINGIAHAVMMLTPSSLENFAVGFAYSEGIIDSVDQIRDMDISVADQHTETVPVKSISIDLTLSPRQFQAYKETHSFRRGLTSCGICGSSALKEAFPDLSPLQPAVRPTDQLLTEVRSNTPPIAGVHFAKLVSPEGQTIVSDEDIGRHNALDKVLGLALRQKLDLHQHYAILSSRCSVELVQKAVRAGLSTLVHLSSPSNLAVEMAKYYQLNLLQITRSNELVVHALSPSERLNHENR